MRPALACETSHDGAKSRLPERRQPRPPPRAAACPSREERLGDRLSLGSEDGLASVHHHHHHYHPYYYHYHHHYHHYHHHLYYHLYRHHYLRGKAA